MNGCDESDYTIIPYRVADEQKYAIAVKGGEFLAFCNYESGAIAVRDDAMRRARRLNGGA